MEKNKKKEKISLIITIIWFIMLKWWAMQIQCFTCPTNTGKNYAIIDMCLCNTNIWTTIQQLLMIIFPGMVVYLIMYWKEKKNSKKRKLI